MSEILIVSFKTSYNFASYYFPIEVCCTHFRLCHFVSLSAGLALLALLQLTTAVLGRTTNFQRGQCGSPDLF